MKPDSATTLTFYFWSQQILKFMELIKYKSLTTVQTFCISICLLKLWNSFPVDLHQCSSIFQFKYIFRNLLLKNVKLMKLMTDNNNNDNNLYVIDPHGEIPICI